MTKDLFETGDKVIDMLGEAFPDDTVKENNFALFMSSRDATDEEKGNADKGKDYMAGQLFICGNKEYLYRMLRQMLRDNEAFADIVIKATKDHMLSELMKDYSDLFDKTEKR